MREILIKGIWYPYVEQVRKGIIQRYAKVEGKWRRLYLAWYELTTRLQEPA